MPPPPSSDASGATACACRSTISARATPACPTSVASRWTRSRWTGPSCGTWRPTPTNPDDLAIAQAIIGLAHSLKLKVVAEGVETTEQLDLLAQQGCDEIQGYYFSRPVAMDEAARMLREGWGLRREAPGGAWRRVQPHAPVGT